MAEVSVFEAAQCLSISPDTVRRRISNGALKARKAETGQSFTWRVELPDDLVASCLRNHEQPHAVQEDSVQALLNSQSALISTLQAQVQVHLQQLEAKDQQISELHVLLQQSQAALPSPSSKPWWKWWSSR